MAASCIGDYRDLTQVELTPIYPSGCQFVLHSSQYVDIEDQLFQIGYDWYKESSHHLRWYEVVQVMYWVEGNFLAHHKVVLKISKHQNLLVVIQMGNDTTLPFKWGWNTQHNVPPILNSSCCRWSGLFSSSFLAWDGLGECGEWSESRFGGGDSEGGEILYGWWLVGWAARRCLVRPPRVLNQWLHPGCSHGSCKATFTVCGSDIWGDMFELILSLKVAVLSNLLSHVFVCTQGNQDLQKIIQVQIMTFVFTAFTPYINLLSLTWPLNHSHS